MKKIVVLTSLLFTLLLASDVAQSAGSEPMPEQQLPQASAGIDLLIILMSAEGAKDIENRPPPPPPVAAPAVEK